MILTTQMIANGHFYPIVYMLNSYHLFTSPDLLLDTHGTSTLTTHTTTLNTRLTDVATLYTNKKNPKLMFTEKISLTAGKKH